MKKTITVKDIAKEANVSIATVSRVLNNIGQVKSSKKDQVLEAARKLGYNKKNISNTIDNSSKCILMFIPDFENPFTSTVIDGVLESINNHGYKILFASTKNFNDSLEDYMDFCQSLSLAGIISLASVKNPEIMEGLGRKFPMVLCSEYPENSALSFVSIDDNKAAKIATEYLLSLGRNDIALVNNSTKNKYARHRQKGFLRTMKEHQIDVPSNWILNLSRIDYSLAFTNIQSLLKSPNVPNAIFAVSDVYAVAAVNAAKSLGYRVPEDISVVGFDNEFVSMMSVPSVTTIMQPSYKIGYQSAELLFDMIETKTIEQKTIIFETELIVRESTAQLQEK
ncbi:LacI family repressor for deo operon, udp, cdd, tsx, nupC, and nupG [Breznakia sp. PF5-3]|uniref:LacI family DNA-binding transcriptional regulator n=1 Tax=unclassified Breznakia TaxID=2623764 RepID=UPI00240694F8|nr:MULTISPECIES: LacI family DNA-binding transcriptional regulator [unclassified Breznakia]MDF9824837.1 LacI family repressor for deo operon, udp, cdd, tsx, nupC, and nupG [Breznakia sp. PM6-1]MDF9835201.1 LacI family repressor for deo operon, udp, cdd, tsx, nupC, and nupG [Breznakia sp. PF5-3]MDF9837313.1 LacI family repressor for deo operon, udp, cdd, tsx, nupC, and nupG [Breznakia sp. PFB2-8]MDF9859763.1 LacI family repressor for deo operon, udp, cdd, tsx, nupC, and nupG [Breznakia sp. PH5-2